MIRTQNFCSRHGKSEYPLAPLLSGHELPYALKFPCTSRYGHASELLTALIGISHGGRKPRQKASDVLYS